MNYILKEKAVTVYIDGEVLTATSEHPNFKRIVRAIREGKKEKKIAKLFNKVKAVQEYLGGGDITINDGVLRYKNEVIHNVLTKKIIDMMTQGFNITPMINFLVNLKDNPSYSAQEELYLYLEAGNLPITEDGHFLSYKGVRDDYKDSHTGTFDNSIGSICEMPRESVDDDRHTTCSYGLHVGRMSYVKDFGIRKLVCKINPRDVVAIPNDYNNAKMRVCRYEVISELYRDDAVELAESLESSAVYGDAEYYIECPSCGYDNLESETYCENCGEEL